MCLHRIRLVVDQRCVGQSRVSLLQPADQLQLLLHQAVNIAPALDIGVSALTHTYQDVAGRTFLWNEMKSSLGSTDELMLLTPLTTWSISPRQ